MCILNKVYHGLGCPTRPGLKLFFACSVVKWRQNLKIVCSFRKYPYGYVPHRGSVEISGRGGGGDLKSQTFSGKCEAQVEFPEGWGPNPINPQSVGKELDILQEERYMGVWTIW